MKLTFTELWQTTHLSLESGRDAIRRVTNKHNMSGIFVDAGAGWYALAPGFANTGQAADLATAGEAAPAAWPQAAVPIRPGMPNDFSGLESLFD